MKSIFRTLVLCTAIIFSQPSFSQITNKSLEKSNKMDNTTNKETIHFLYDSILNKKQFELLSEIISVDYTTHSGDKGVLPIDLSNFFVKKENSNAIYFIDKFSVPKTSIEEFVKQMDYNREFIKTLAGYKGGQAFEQYDNDGNLTIITIAVWENNDKLNEAKAAVQKEFMRIGFNPIEFYQQLNIKMQRRQYQNIKE